MTFQISLTNQEARIIYAALRFSAAQLDGAEADSCSMLAVRLMRECAEQRMTAAEKEKRNDSAH